MESKLFEIVSNIKSPLAIIALVILAFYLLYRLILKRIIFEKLTEKHTFQVINKVIDYAFILTYIALIIFLLIFMFLRGDKRSSIEKAIPTIDTTFKEVLEYKLPSPKFPTEEEKKRLASTSTLEGFKVVHFIVKKEKPFPLINITLQNDLEKNMIITEIKTVIYSHSREWPIIKEPTTYVLEPVAICNIELPDALSGTFIHKLEKPVVISTQNAATITVQLYKKDLLEGFRPPHDTGDYVFKIVFVSASRVEAETQFFMLVNGSVYAE